MENAGFTIFQGGESLKIDTSLSRLEEEEALEDQKRRNEELGNQLQYAFDDLIDDDECTVDSSYRNLTNNVLRQNSPNKETEISKQQIEYGHGDHNMCRDEIGKLEKTIESKNREIENISKLVFEERKKNDELKKRLALSEAEKERALMQKQQTHELLVESKTQISELEDSITKLKTKIKNLEDTNNELVGELERTKTMLMDIQHKYHLVERNANLNADKNADNIIKQINERHSAQIQMMQHQIDNIKSKLDEKENEYKTLDIRYKELQRSRETLLIEKSEIINNLARNLEESQRQCQQLMSKQDFQQENIRLQRLVNALEKQTEDMQKTINQLTSRLELTTAELEIMDSVLCENGNNNDSPRRLSQTNGNVIGSTPITVTDRITKLKNELYRSMASQKQKRDEIKKLQDELNVKINEIKKLKEYENKTLIEIEMYKDEKLRFESKIQSLELELHKVKMKNANKECDMQEDFQEKYTEINNKNEILETELKRIKEDYRNLEENNKKMKLEIDGLHSKLKHYKEQEVILNTKLKNLTSDFEKMKKENEQLRNSHENKTNDIETFDVLKVQLEKYKFLLKDAQNECDRVKSMYEEVSNAKDTLSIEFKELKDKCIKIEEALRLAEVKCEELQKLLDNQKIIHEKELNDLKSQLEKEKACNVKSTKDSINNCSKCLNKLAEISKYEIEIFKLKNQCTEQLKTQTELENRLKEAQNTIDELTEKLVLKNENDRRISELQIKAQQFEEYIKNQSNSNGSSSGISSPKQLQHHQQQPQSQNHIKFDDKSVETSPELDEKHDHHIRRQIETEIRNEMAKTFAYEMKRIEKQFKENFGSLEEQNIELKNDLHKINIELKHRQNEVQILKHAILLERQKMQDTLKTYENESKEIIDKHIMMLNACQNELKLKTERIEELIKELNERNLQIESERQSMKAVMTQWEEQKQKNDEQINKWKKLIDDHEKVVEQLQIKYNSAKKTAANYKKYAEDKEKHMLQEYERIKSEYDASLIKIEKKMKEILEKRENDMKDRIREIETNYDKKLEELKRKLELDSNKKS